MDITGTCLDGKERLLTQECYLSLPQNKANSRRSRCVNSSIHICTVLNTVACIVSCFCAAYCYKVLTDIKSVQYFETTSSGISVPLVAPTEASDLPRADFDIDSDIYHDEYSGWLEYDSEEYEDVLDEDEVVDGSGVSRDQGFSDYPDTTDHIRERRAAKSCTCKGKTGKRFKRCMKRCQPDGKTKQSVNLQTAHFEASISEEEMKKFVPVEFNSNVNKENGPLNIFKPAQWVDSITSPVKFNKSVAQAKSAGIYLVYAQAYIGGKQPKKSITVVQKHNGEEVNALSCNNGVHPDYFDSLSGMMQTCSVLGLMNVQKGDTIEVQTSSASADITLDKDKTYFGIIQLSAVTLNGDRKPKKNSKS